MIKDIMAAMLESQRLVQEGYNHTFPKPPAETMRYLTEMAFSVCDEVHEAMGETGWKSWASSNHINREEFMGEMADAFLFFMNMMLAVEMTSDELIERVAKKQDNSFARQRDGYDGVTTKCPACQRAYDNDGVKCQPGYFDHTANQDVAPVCGYVPPPKATGIITETKYPANACPGCGNPYDSNIARNCFPQSQGFGWCAVKSLTIGLQVVELSA